MHQTFTLCLGAAVQNARPTPSVQTALAALRRDLALRAASATQHGALVLEQDAALPAEDFSLCVQPQRITLTAADDLGFVYGVYYISEVFLGVPPFWFWMDTPLCAGQTVRIPCGVYTVPPCAVRYRGWFLNDEVLLDFMAEATGSDLLWDMAFEALLRCRGNLVIPGTDKNAHRLREKAAACGLWLTHHHAEPLGAPMFSRVFPHLPASYRLHAAEFTQLWQQAVARQAGTPTIYTLGFRGQGDRPFWEDDPAYQTPEQRGALLSEILRTQYDLVQNTVPGAPCCTNLYGEMMELYQAGHLRVPPQVIAVWADNGYGKMVSRRQGDEDLRVPSLPQGPGRHGVYYHVSFYDLQAANHITLFPNSMSFLADELRTALTQGAKDYCIVNASNIRPHVFALDLLRKLWQGQSAAHHAHIFARLYYGANGADNADGADNVGNADSALKNGGADSRSSADATSGGSTAPNATPNAAKNTPQSTAADIGAADRAPADPVAACLARYARCTPRTGPHEDQRAGEQLYTHSVRALARAWMHPSQTAAPELQWAIPAATLAQQVAWLARVCAPARARFTQLLAQCIAAQQTLPEAYRAVFDRTFVVQIRVQLACLAGVQHVSQAHAAWEAHDIPAAFTGAGLARGCFADAHETLRASEHGVWHGFYENECLSDCAFTAEALTGLMHWLRAMGDGPRYFEWQRALSLSPQDAGVMLITHMRNRWTNDAMFAHMQQQYSQLQESQEAQESEEQT